MQRKIWVTACWTLKADAYMKAECCSYQHYSKALRHGICQEACCKVWPHHQEHIQVKYCCPHTLWGSTLSQLLFNQEVMFVTALGKLMAPFLHRRGEIKKNVGGSTYHTHSCIWRWWWGGEGWVRVPGFFFFYITTSPVCYRQQRCVWHHAWKKSRIKVDDISQQSL